VPRGPDWCAPDRGGGTPADRSSSAAGTYNTQKRCTGSRDDPAQDLARLGYLTRTNSEALLGVRVPRPEHDYTQGVAITSSWHSGREHPHRAGALRQGQQRHGLLTTLMTDGGTRRHRWAQFLLALLRNPLRLRLSIPRRWSERVIILLVMQSLNNS